MAPPRVHSVDDDHGIVAVSKEVAEAQSAMVESLRAQLRGASDEIAAVKRQLFAAEQAAISKDDLIESLMLSKEAQLEEKEALCERVKVQSVRMGLLELELEELRDSRSH